MITSDELDEEDFEFHQCIFTPSAYYDYDQFVDLSKNINKSMFTVLNTNARSLVKNMSNYEIFLDRLKQDGNFIFDALTFEESWLNNDLEDLVNLEGYSLVTKHKINKKEGGGLAIYIRNRWKFKILDIAVPHSLQHMLDCLFLEIECKPKPLIIGVVYRSPSQNSQQQLIDFLEPILSQMSTAHNEVIIVGDTNIDMLKHSENSLTSSYIDNFVVNSFVPKITLPTRVSHSSATLIDHIFHKMSQGNTVQGTILSDISDHYINFIGIEMSEVTDPQPEYVTYRLMNSEAIQRFNDALKSTSWEDVVSADDVNGACDLFINKYITQMNTYLPLKTVKFNRKYHKIKPWISKGIMISMKKRQKLHSKCLKCRNQQRRISLEGIYKEYRNLLNKIIRKAKQLYYSQVFNACLHDMKGTWRQINTILSKTKNKQNVSTHFTENGTQITNPQEISNEFNNFFINIGPKLNRQCPSTPCTASSFLPNVNITNSLFFEPSTVEETYAIIQKLKPKTSCGHDNISPKLLKQTAQSILLPITHIVNLSLASGIFPENMKIAKVVPIFKNGSSYYFNNYRPVSLLPSCSKILERIVFTRLHKFLDKYSLLTPSQYGFRPNFSTELAILELQNSIINNLSCNKQTIGLFLDLSKAFDCLNHEILLKKLSHYGIRGVPLKWFKSYLLNRKQFTSYNSVNSTMLSITTGVPQGSILGPLLFILYVNDIVSTSNHVSFILFADDTNMIVTSENLNFDNMTLNQEINNLSIWFSANKLTINESKTKYILFRKDRIPSRIKLELYINGNRIDKVQHIKFLGVIITETLSWQLHINEICKKISRTIGILSRLKHELPYQVLLTIYKSLIGPYLNYAITAWGSSPKSHLLRIHKLKKKAMRIITRSKFSAHTDPLFLKNKILKLDDMYKLRCSLIYHKYWHGILPNYHQNCLHPIMHSYYTRNHGAIYINRIKSNLEKHSLNYKIAIVWNQFPAEIKNTVLLPLKKFSSKLKFHFLDTYRTSCQIRNCFSCSMSTHI